MLIRLHNSGGASPDISPMVDSGMLPSKGDKVRTGQGWQEVIGLAWEVDNIGRLTPTGVFLKKKKKKPARPAGEPVITVPLSGGDEWPVTADLVDEWSKAFPGIDVMQELNKLRQWNLANRSRRKTEAGIMNHITSWLGRAQDGSSSGGRAPAATSIRTVVDSLLKYKEEERRATRSGDVYDSSRDIWHYEIVVPSRRISGGMKAVWEEYNKVMKEKSK